MPKTIYSYVLIEGTTEHPTKVRVDVWVACGTGKKFKGIAFISQPCSENPALTFPKPYGVNGIKKILRNIKNGISPSDIIDRSKE